MKPGFLAASGSATSVSANSVSTDQVSGTYQYAGPGTWTLFAKASATGMFVTFIVGGQTIIQDKAIAFTGTAGTIDISANMIAQQLSFSNGKAELYFRNSTGGALTADYFLFWDPLGPDFLRGITRRVLGR